MRATSPAPVGAGEASYRSYRRECEVHSSKPQARVRRGLSMAAAVIIGGVLALGNANSAQAGDRSPADGTTAAVLPVAIIFPGGFGVPKAGGTDVVRDGIFAGLVNTDPAQANVRWNRSADSYIGPGGHRYYQYRHIETGACLSHVLGIVLTDACVWSDSSQWWAVVPEPTIPHLADTPSAVPAPIHPKVLSPWDASHMAATAKDGLVYLNDHTAHQPSQWVVGVS